MVTQTIPIPSPELAPIVERVRVRLLELPPERLYEAGIAANTGVATSFDKKGIRKEPIAFTTKFKDGAAVEKALKTGSLELLECVLWMLEVVDRELALEESLAIRALPPPARTLKNQHDFVNSFDELVRTRAQYVISRNVDLLPVETLLNVAARGDLIGQTVNDAIRRHPLLQTGDAIVKALRQSRWGATPPDAPDYPRDRDLADHFLKTLASLDFRAGAPALEDMFREAGAHEIRWKIARTLEGLGSTLPQKTLSAMAADGLLEDEGPINPAGDRRWPPILRWAVSAVFAEDPLTAYDKLTHYLDRPRLTEAFVTHGTITTVADGIASVLEPRRVSRKDDVLHIHDGDVSARIDQLTHPDKFVFADPGEAVHEADARWATFIARMAADDPWWERYAWRFQALSAGELAKKMRSWERRRKSALSAEATARARLPSESRASKGGSAKRSRKDA